MNIQVPKQYAEKREEQMRVKLNECEDKLNQFLKDENLVLMPSLDYSPAGIMPSVKVFPREFLKLKDDLEKVEEKGKPNK